MKPKNVKIPEAPTACHECGKVRGKRCQPWKTCTSCGEVFCYDCILGAHNGSGRPECHPCFRKRCDAERRAKQSAPVTCPACGGTFSRSEISNDTHTPGICLRCVGVHDRVD